MAFERRGSTWLIAGRTSDPPRALANLLERDRLFTDRLRGCGRATIDVAPGMSEDELARRVEQALSPMGDTNG
ncbi:hypothetical protein [Actinoplanes solisilvae]|uniref:hypothetical protein n=1 Tax=Actinoplanes solisilvae TaxID=2486853 RepID=UPI000FD8FFC7|nr:hypothetical protein [Actinoplanes solisilvae]